MGQKSSDKRKENLCGCHGQKYGPARVHVQGSPANVFFLGHHTCLQLQNFHRKIPDLTDFENGPLQDCPWSSLSHFSCQDKVEEPVS